MQGWAGLGSGGASCTDAAPGRAHWHLPRAAPGSQPAALLLLPLREASLSGTEGNSSPPTTTLLPSEVKAALFPDTLYQQPLWCSRGRSSLAVPERVRPGCDAVGLGGCPPRELWPPGSIPVGGGRRRGWPAPGWLGGTASISVPAMCHCRARATGGFWLPNRPGTAAHLNHWTHLVRKAPEADRQEPACLQPAAAGVHHPAQFWGSNPEKSAFRFCPGPTPIPSQTGTAGGLRPPRGTGSAPRQLPVCPAVPTAPCAGGAGPVAAQGEGRLRAEAAMPALIKQRHILGLLAKRP